jgi:hypothetical protein
LYLVWPFDQGNVRCGNCRFILDDTIGRTQRD